MVSRPVIGIDLGGTQLRAALVTNGRLLHRLAVPTHVQGGPHAILDQIGALIDTLQRRGGEKPAAIGVSSPGPLDSDEGIVLGIPTLPGWDGFPLRAALSDRLGLPVTLENDAISAAFGEWKYGAGRGLRHLVYVTVSTGIGGGAVIDGELMRGRRGMACHFGHMLLDPDGPRCACGATGCFEALASGTALAARAVEAARKAGTGHLAQCSGPLTGRDVEEGARLGDPLCLTLLDEEAQWLGIGFTSLFHLFSPDAVIMGGGVSHAFDLLESRIREVIGRQAMPPFRGTRLFKAGLGADSGLIGAAALAEERLGP